MSVDYYLYSPKHDKEVQVGSNGFSGVQSYPATDECVEFIRWAIDNFVTDIVLVDEHRLYALKEENGNPD